MTLSRENVDDSALNQLFNDLPGRCIILMEDVDVAFVHGVSRSDTEPDAASSLTAKSKLSLSGILNALDGVGAQEGRLLFATTNRIDALDSALCRLYRDSPRMPSSLRASRVPIAAVPHHPTVQVVSVL